MSDEIMLVFGEDGVAREYDDTWDITIHCESEEEQKAVLEKLNNSNQEAKNSTESSLTQKGLDTISRQAAIETLNEQIEYCNKALGSFDISPKDEYAVKVERASLEVYKEQLENLPSAQPERKTGRWLIREGISDAQCSECKMYFRDVYDMDNSDAFCRHCGTKMEGLKVVEDE